MPVLFAAGILFSIPFTTFFILNNTGVGRVTIKAFCIIVILNYVNYVMNFQNCIMHLATILRYFVVGFS